MAAAMAGMMDKAWRAGASGDHLVEHGRKCFQ